ncbi:hypothetical protein CHISP_0922 [Chitinispirillum alkaliphilum]|nr:hypothetical protein CHISP_0922 [Chitinispirillum alkaliphilum]
MIPAITMGIPKYQYPIARKDPKIIESRPPALFFPAKIATEHPPKMTE